MQFSNRQVFLIIVAVAVVGALVFILFSSRKTGTNCGFNCPQTKTSHLVVWGVDEPKAFSAIKQNFEKLHKDVSVSYVQLAPEVIQGQLVSALASGQGPDVVMIKNRTLSEQKSLLMPAPTARISFTSLQKLFPTVVEQDFTDSKQVYALPLSIDTLALVYNKDFFDQARIPNPPATWSELADMVPQLVQTSQGGRIDRAAAAIGGSDRSITNAGDLLALLFLQSGLSLAKPDFSSGSQALTTLNFYLQFSNPRSLAYTWSDIQANDLESFANLRTAMVLAYKKQIEGVVNQNTFLRYGVAPLPQLGTARVDYADYWGLAVPRASKQPALAWEFVTYAATIPQNATAYNQATKSPPALKSLLQANYDDLDIGVFARQALTARSWPAIDDNQARTIFSDMASGVLTGQADAVTALGRAQNLLTAIIHK